MPNPPHTNMMHIVFPTDAETLLEASVAVARDKKVALVTTARSLRSLPGYSLAELVVGDGVASITDQDLRELLPRLVSFGND